LWNISSRNTLYTTIKRYAEKRELIPVYKGLYSTVPIDQLDPIELGKAVIHRFIYLTTESTLSLEGIISQTTDCLHITLPLHPIMYNYRMKTLSEIQDVLRAYQPILADQYGIQIVGVFGSYVRHEQRPDSDLDILIELNRPPKISLIGLVELEDHLSQILGVKVDIAIKTNLKKRIGQRILQEVVSL
jgi:uncharacterized protein